jgi:hypothetical protein
LFEEWVKKVHTLKKKVVDNKNKIWYNKYIEKISEVKIWEK